MQTIAATTTRTGLTVSAELDSAAYPKGIKISDRQVKDLEQRALRRHQFHGEWNYRLIPARAHNPACYLSAGTLVWAGAYQTGPAGLRAGERPG